MIKRLLFVLALLPARAGLAQPPRLAVVFVVDQMRADYLTRYDGEFKGGFARFYKEGAVFENARQGHVPTETAVGHADISTGRFPYQHGIVANDWWDKEAGKMAYCMDDAKYERSPANLLVPTVGDAFKQAHPAAKIVSVSGKDRAAILMGGHKADLALWYNRSAGQFVTSGYYGKLPDWVWAWDAALRIPAAERESIIATPRFDQLILDLSRRAVEEQKIGAGPETDFLWISLSATDYTGHKYSQDSPQMHQQLVALDRELGNFLDYLDGRLGRGNYTAVLTADHGVSSIPESEAGHKAGARRVMIEDFQRGLEEGLAKRLGPAKDGKWVLAMAPPYIYLNMPLALKLRVGPDRLLEEAARLLEAEPIVRHVFGPKELRPEAGSKAPFAEVFRRSFYPARSGELMVLVKEGILLASDPFIAEHGVPYDSDARVPLAFLGYEIRPGHYRGDVLVTSMAPTLAKILEIGFDPAPDSRVLKEALQTR